MFLGLTASCDLRTISPKVALGKFHALAMSYQGKLYSWGRNDIGQLGRGFKSPMELVPELAVDINTDREHCLDISCGVAHSMAIIRVGALVR